MGFPQVPIALQLLHQQIDQMHRHVLQPQQFGRRRRLPCTHHVEHGAKEGRTVLGQVARGIGGARLARAKIIDDFLKLRDNFRAPDMGERIYATGGAS
jgi:hypothetical protein